MLDEQLRCGLGDEACQFSVSSSMVVVRSLMRRISSRAMRTRAVGSARCEALATYRCQRAASARAWGFSTRPEVVQLPAQFVDQPGAGVDQALAMDDQQPDLELGPAS